MFIYKNLVSHNGITKAKHESIGWMLSTSHNSGLGFQFDINEQLSLYKLPAEDSRFNCRQVKKIFSSARRSNKLWGPLNFILNGYRVILPWV